MPDRLDAALRQRGEDVSHKSREKFIIAFGEALIDDTIDQLSHPERYPPARLVELPLGSLESPRSRALRHLSQAKQPRTQAKPKPDPLSGNRELNGYFGGLLCSVAVARWQELRRLEPEIGWQIDEEERWELREPEKLSLKPIISAQRHQRRKPFYAETLIRTAVISALTHPGICGLHEADVIRILHEHRAFWRRITGLYTREAFQSERSRVCKAFQSGHEDPRYRQSVLAS